MKVYFEKYGSGDNEVYLTAYVSPKPSNGGYCGYEYDLFGKRSKFYWVHPDEARIFDSKELPTEMLYSIKHGNNNFTVSREKADNYNFEDLEYEKVDKKKVEQTLIGLKLIDDCKTLDDVFDVWQKYIKDNYLTFEFASKGLSIIGHPSIPMINGELGIYTFDNEMLFLNIMENEEKKRKK